VLYLLNVGQTQFFMKPTSVVYWRHLEMEVFLQFEVRCGSARGQGDDSLPSQPIVPLEVSVHWHSVKVASHAVHLWGVYSRHTRGARDASDKPAVCEDEWG
jgi:hypothetical protein